jgi:hypothetical protein
MAATGMPVGLQVAAEAIGVLYFSLLAIFPRGVFRAMSAFSPRKRETPEWVVLTIRLLAAFCAGGTLTHIAILNHAIRPSP